MDPRADITRLLSPLSLACAAGAAVILVLFLLRRPSLSAATKVWLFFGIAVLPVGAALTGNIVGYEISKRREFCASCHTMQPWVDDAGNPESTTLAAMHSRNRQFGDESCYVCHQNYEMYGTVTTKLTGMRHLWVYSRKYSGGRPVPPGAIRLYRPFSNTTCNQCHSMSLPGWLDEPEHQAVLEDVRSGEVSCAAEGCHGPAHPATEVTP